MLKRAAMLLAVAVLCIQVPSLGQDKQGVKVDRELKKLCKERIAALTAKDTKTLGNICASTYRLITQTGKQMDLAQLKKSVSESDVSMSSSTLQSFQSFVAEDGSMAFAVAELAEDVVDKKQVRTTNNLLITEVYVKQSGKWKIQLTHVSQKICMFPE